MKKIIFFFFIFNISILVKAQVGFNKFSIYGNLGTTINDNFEYKPTSTASAQIGLKYYFKKGVSFGIDFNSIYFKKTTDLNEFLSNYYTQVTGVNMMVLYEYEVIPKWYVGAGAALNIGLFMGRVYSDYARSFNEIKGKVGDYSGKPFYNYVGILNVRKFVNRKVDLQAGLSYNYFQSYFLDMYNGNNKKLDTYTVVYLGMVFKFGKSDGPAEFLNSLKVSCPKF